MPSVMRTEAETRFLDAYIRVLERHYPGVVWDRELSTVRLATKSRGAPETGSTQTDRRSRDA